MPAQPDYIIVHARDPEALCAKVVEWLHSGFVPLGAPFVRGVGSQIALWYQAMQRAEDLAPPPSH